MTNLCLFGLFFIFRLLRFVALGLKHLTSDLEGVSVLAGVQVAVGTTFSLLLSVDGKVKLHLMNIQNIQVTSQEYSGIGKKGVNWKMKPAI